MPGWRLMRAVVLGAVPVGLAAAGHASAGGGVAAAPVALLCLASVAAALALFPRALRPLPILLVASATQLATHVVLGQWGVPHGAPMSAPGHHSMTAPGMAGSGMPEPAAPDPGMASALMADSAMAGVPMLLGHLAAGVLSALVMVHCDALVLAARRLVSNGFHRPVPRLVRPVRIAGAVAVWVDPAIPAPVSLETPVSRRGPPRERFHQHIQSPALAAVAVS